MLERNKEQAIASIDLGTYGCRMIVGVPAKNHSHYKIISRFSQTVKLIVDNEGDLSSASRSRLMRSLQQCHSILCKFNITNYRCVGTAACRAVQDRSTFVKSIKEETGIHLEIITPREEIELAALGAMSVFAKNTKVKFIFDIGGGSTEFGIFVYTNHAPKCVAFASLPYGILTLNPFATSDIKKAFSDHVRTVVQDMFSGCSIAHNINSVQAITTSGPLATIITLNEGLTGYHGPNIHGLNMQYYTILHWIDKIEQMGSEEFSRSYGISNAMMSGLSILRGIVEATKIPIYISNTGVRDGILKSLFTERRLNQ